MSLCFCEIYSTLSSALYPVNKSNTQINVTFMFTTVDKHESLCYPFDVSL